MISFALFCNSFFSSCQSFKLAVGFGYHHNYTKKFLYEVDLQRLKEFYCMKFIFQNMLETTNKVDNCMGIRFPIHRFTSERLAIKLFHILINSKKSLVPSFISDSTISKVLK